MRAVFVVTFLLNLISGPVGADILCRDLFRSKLPYEKPPLETPFAISLDSQLAKKMAGTLKSVAKIPEDLILQGYDYAAGESVLVNDRGYIPNIWASPPEPRRIDIANQRISVHRDLSREEIEGVQKKAREAVLESYEGLIQPKIKEAVDAVEAILDPSFINFGIVRDNRTGNILGVVRVAKAYVRDGKIILPALEILRQRGLMTPENEKAINELFLNKVLYHSGVVEVGQYHIEKSLSPEVRLAIRDLLITWVSESNLSPNKYAPDVTVHTSRKAHDRVWAGLYGVKHSILSKEGSDGIVENFRGTAGAEFYRAAHGQLSHARSGDDR